MFDVGVTYNRKRDIQKYGGQRQGGISTPAKKPYIFLFTSDAGESFGYSDQFRPDGTFWYTGEGQVGDMAITKGNLAIRDHKKLGKALYLFEYERHRKGFVRFLGSATCVGHHIEERPDRLGTLRNAIVFHLALDVTGDTEDGIPPNVPIPSPKTLRRLSIDELRALALRGSKRTATRKQVEKLVTVRSEAIKLYALRRAKGICEGCKRAAPFKSKAIGPYLEVHHLYRLGDGGPDHPANVISLCPTCHRRVHFSVDGVEYNKALVDEMVKIEPPTDQ